MIERKTGELRTGLKMVTLTNPYLKKQKSDRQGQRPGGPDQNGRDFKQQNSRG